MEDWVRRALQKWPNVPALYGWLRLDRRGRWRIRGEIITRPQIIDTINRNYAADDRGRWFFQNGPQRGYVSLDHAPLVLRSDGAGLITHTGLAVTRPQAAYLDADGTLLLATEHGPGALDDHDFDWLLDHLSCAGANVDEATLAAALAQPSGTQTPLSLRIGTTTLPLSRLDFDAAPQVLGFVRDPQPDA